MRVSPAPAASFALAASRLCLLTGLLVARLAAASGGVVLTEIHYHPVEEAAFNADGTPVLDLTDDVYEFVEIQNTGAATLDLAGWTLGGGISYTFPAGATIAAGGYRVVAKNPALLASVYSLIASTVLGPYTGKLGNSGDTVRLRDSSGAAVDSVTYGSAFPWPASADALGAQDRFTGLVSTAYQYKGRSLQRVSVTSDAGDPANWLASPLSPGPTPGAAQSVTRTVPKPVVVAQNFAQTSDGATIVRAGNIVTVNCTYSSTASLSSVQVEYFLDDINSTAETRTVVAMTDLGSGKYTATLPAQVDRSVVRYRFKANRGDGVEVVSPRADDPQIAPIGASGAREAWHGYFVTPVRTSTNAIYDVLVSTAALTQLNTNITQNPKRTTLATAAGLPREFPYVAATAPQWSGTQHAVFSNNGALWDIQIRYHGSRYHRAASNNSFKLHFPENHPFNNQSSWFVTGHGTEFMEAQKINRLLGLPSSQMRTVDWYYNSNAKITRNEQGEYGGEMLDAYHELQQQLAPGSAKEDNGELYKVVGNRDASQNNLEGPYTRGDCAPMLANASWTQLQRYEWTMSIQSNSWKGPKPIRDLIEGMWTARGDTPATHNFSSNATSLANTKAWFEANFDTDALLTSLALLEWISIWDDAAHNQFFWRRANGKWVRLGWDYDGVMSTSSGGGSGMGGGPTQTIYGGEYGATNVFDGVNWWKDTFYKCYRTEFKQRLWELNNSFFEPLNLTANGLTTAATFAASRQASVNTQLALGTFTKPVRPTNSTPATGATVLSATNLVAGAYSHPSSSTHASTKWEIRSASGTYEEPVLRSTSTTAKTSLAIPFDLLTYGQTYYWRVTYIDSTNHASIVSAETSFTWGTTSTTAGTLVLNEVLAYNRNTVQNGADYPDYIELRNNGATAASIAGYTLTDDPLVPAKYTFPAGTTLAAGAYLIVWADKDTTAPGLHAGFGLNSDGDQVILLNGSTIVDSVTFGPQAPDLSIGRIVNGTGGWQANAPTPATANNAKTLGSTANLRVNEWMASPAYGEDWFELHNLDTAPVALGGLYLSDTPSTPAITQIPALSFIAGGGHARFWADGSADGGAHANFKLGASGESLVLTAANAATTLDTVTFGAQTKDVAQGRLPDGGATIVAFSASTASPAYANWAPVGVVINEVIAHAASPFEDAIELHNPTASTVAIGGWWLSDDLANRKKYQIPAGTTLAAGAYLTIYQSAFSAGTVPFTLSATGDEVILSAMDGSGALTGYGALVRFGSSLENTSFGRVAATGLSPTSGGAEFWTQSAHTFGQDNPASVAVFRTGAGAANSTPKIGPVTINEVMYHPVDGAGSVDITATEFVELHNTTSSAVALSGWRLRGDTEFTFSSGASIAAGGYVLLVNFDPTNATTLAAFRTTYGLTAATPVYGPYSQPLANSTFDVELAQPVTIGGNATYVNVDKVEYRDTSPWPTTPDGTGKSLQRSSETTIANTAANWTGNTPTPGAVNLGLASSLAISSASPLPGGVLGVAYSTTLSGTGGTSPYTWAITSGSVPGLTLSTAGVLSGTPTATGASSLTISLTDAVPATVSKTLSLTIAATPLAIGIAAALPNGAVGSAYAATLAATGGTAPYVWTVASGTLPPGLTLNGTGVLSGTPTTPVAASFTVLVTDAAALAATRAFTLAVPVPALVVTGTAALPDATMGAAYSQALTATGGVSPYSWTLAAGSTLPAGLTLAADGTLSGTPTAPGAYSFTVRLTDAATTTTTQTITLNVVATTLSVTTTELPAGIVSESYSATLAAGGGLAPYTWAASASAWPSGLAFSSSGLLVGAPSANGSTTITFTVTDALGASASRALVLVVADSDPLDHFSWDYVPDAAYATRRFAVRLTARDASERLVTTFNDTVDLAAANGTGITSPVLITEIADGDEAQFELQNVTGSTVDTTGWFVLLGDGQTDINTLNPVAYALPSGLASGALLRVSELNSTAGSRLYFGGPIGWSNAAGAASRGWLMLFDATGALRDFAVVGWTSADLGLLSVLINGDALTTAGHWSGAPLAPGSRGPAASTTDSWQRVGVSDTNTAADWSWSHNSDNSVATTFAATNAGLILPWTAAVPLTVTPAAATLSGGVFTGLLAIAEPAADARLAATGPDGHAGVSDAFAVATFADTDADGIPDAWETARGLTVGSATNDATLDSDGDGQSNLAEFLAGTDPLANTSVFAVTALTYSAGGGSPVLAVTWAGVSGRYYRVVTSPDLGTWATAAEVLATSDGTRTVNIPAGDDARVFARVVLVE